MAVIWARKALLSDGWADSVRLETGPEGTIRSVRKGVPCEGRTAGILLPAAANIHSHAFQRSMAGLTEQRGPDVRDTFWTWRQLMFRFLEQLTPDHVEAIAAFVQMEMLEAGYAASVEFHYLHHQPSGAPYDNLAEMSERIVAAASTTGIGLTLLPVHYQYGGCDKRALDRGQVRFGNDFERFARLAEGAARTVARLPADCRSGVAPHSLRAVAAEDVQAAVRLAGDGPIHMHLSEQQAEVDEVVAHYGARPVTWFLDNCEAGPRWCLIHCTQMHAGETERLARSGAVAGICPITEGNLGDGTFDAVRWLAADGVLAIGSDSNIRISYTEEVRALEYSQRLRDHSRAALATTDKSTGRRLLEAVALGGAQASGRRSGDIREGALADLVALDDGHTCFLGRSGDTLIDSYIFAGDDRLVTDVWSAGRHLVMDGRHVAHTSITNRYRTVMNELQSAL
ncbi:MAG TPA: formimidoylglutamate deiminase [Hyphomonas sp.]|nr:formimidoylglutamate deiminase [Hyphomonas sp.]HRK67556.1 formimidoylglutamate deiminase [Hyphomonas sp.]